jgi:hypothetical protein
MGDIYYALRVDTDSAKAAKCKRVTGSFLVAMKLTITPNLFDLDIVERINVVLSGSSPRISLECGKALQVAPIPSTRLRGCRTAVKSLAWVNVTNAVIVQVSSIMLSCNVLATAQSIK